MKDYEIEGAKESATIFFLLVLVVPACLTRFYPPRVHFLAPSWRAVSSYRFSHPRAVARETSRLESYLLLGVSVSLPTSVRS